MGDLNITGMAILAVMVTVCLTFYIVACAKNVDPTTDKPSPNYTLLISILFMFFTTFAGGISMKVDNGMFKDWLFFTTGAFLCSTFIFPIVLYMTSVISLLAMILSTCGNVSLVLVGVIYMWKQAREGGSY